MIHVKVVFQRKRGFKIERKGSNADDRDLGNPENHKVEACMQ